MFSVIPLSASLLLAIPQQDPGDVTPQQSSALDDWLSSRSTDWQANVQQQQAVKFGIQADLFLALTEKADAFDQYNRLRLRSLVFNAQQSLGFGAIFASFAVGDYDDFDEVVIPQLGIILTDIQLGLPGVTDLQIGRYFADVGAFNSYLPADFMAPHIDGTRRSFLGGNLSLLGLELDNNAPFSEGHFHFSLGVASERQSLDFDNFDEPVVAGSNDDQRFSASNWMATSRASLQFDFSANNSMRIGATAIVSPAEVVFTDVDTANPERAEIEHNNFGAELGFIFNTATTRSHELSFELWADDRQYRDSLGAYPYSLSRGEWAMYQFNYDEKWSIGALGSRYDILGLSASDDDGSHHSAWLSYTPDFGGALSLFGTHTNPGDGLEKYFTVGLEYSINVGRPQTRGLSRWY